MNVKEKTFEDLIDGISRKFYTKSHEEYLIDVEKFLTKYDGEVPSEERTERIAPMLQEWIKFIDYTVYKK